MLSSGPSLAVLDMVGTTVRADDHVSEAFREACGQFEIPLTAGQISAVRGRSKVEAIHRLVGLHLPDPVEADAVADRVYAAFRVRLLQRYGSRAREIPGASGTLAWLEERGVGVSLTTGLDRETAVSILERLGWGHRVARMLSGDDVEHGRPAPDLIQAAMRIHGVQRSGAVVAVGDTVVDLEAANAAGVGWSVGVLSGAHDREMLMSRPHSVLLPSVADLPTWLEHLD